MDIIEQTLNDQHDVYAKAREEYRKVIQQQRDEIERLRDLVKKWQALEKEAAMYVEGVICVRSAHFTGKEPYVGWLGLGRALTKDYDDMKRMREALKSISKIPNSESAYGIIQVFVDDALKEKE